MILCASAGVVVLLLRQFFASTRPEYSWGDGALLELYTIHASRDGWQLGPYSRFGWHHPGPLLFYALSPVYRLFGSHTFALNAGAFFVNIVSLLVIAWAVVRWARPSLAYAMLAMMGVFLFRVGDITISYWNPHVVVVPFAAFVMTCAALWAGRAAALASGVLSGSFLVQTHVGLAPVVAALGAASLVGLVTADYTERASARPRSRMWWVAAACAAAIVWWPPIVEELSGSPGNLSKLAAFFAAPYAGQSWTAAASVWGDRICAVFRRDLRVPTGMTVQAASASVWTALAVVQLALLLLAARASSRRDDRFLAAMCRAGVVASLVALWSITRIREQVTEHLVFWIVILGALNWAALIGAAVSRLAPASVQRFRSLPALTMVGLAAFVVIEAAQFRHNTRQPPEEPARRVGVLSNAVLAHLQAQHIQRPLVRYSPELGSEAAGIIVHLYKHGVPVTVSSDMVKLFGLPSARAGTTDAVIDIAAPSAHAELSRRSSDQLVASDREIYVHIHP